MKKEAIASTALKLSLIGSVLIFVARQNMVMSQAREVIQAMGANPEEHTWTNEIEWQAFKLACEEAYGINSELFKVAKYGVLCHHSGLFTEVRLATEKLMREANPKIIISTTTLGQGVNIGVSSVIFAHVFIDEQKRIKNNDFWNIAGRAGRSFVDREGKILFAVDASREKWKAKRDRELANEYFQSGNQKPAISGLLYIITLYYFLYI